MIVNLEIGCMLIYCKWIVTENQPIDLLNSTYVNLCTSIIFRQQFRWNRPLMRPLVAKAILQLFKRLVPFMHNAILTIFMNITTHQGNLLTHHLRRKILVKIIKTVKFYFLTQREIVSNLRAQCLQIEDITHNWAKRYKIMITTKRDCA